MRTVSTTQILRARPRRELRDVLRSPRLARALARPGDARHRARNARLLADLGNGARLNIGCGPNALDGWTNIDRGRTTMADVRLDLRGGLPLPGTALQFAYSEHVIEHMDRRVAKLWLTDLRNGARADGIVRIATPDLAFIVERYCHDWRDQAWLRGPEYGSIQGPAEMLNTALRAWGHVYVYDEDDLTRLCREAGFTRVSRCAWGESVAPELAGLETRVDSTLVVEARP